MSSKAYLGLGERNSQTPQRERVPGAAGQRQELNHAGGYTFAVDDWKRLDRFLILGSEGSHFYVGERELTKENAACVTRCLALDGPRVVRTILDVSDRGRAPKNDPALLALAMAASWGDVATRKAALQALPQIARIGTHLFHFMSFVEQFRGHGRSLNGALRRWYLGQAPAALALQLAKYQQRDGWSHRDVLRLCKPKAGTDEISALLGWAVGKPAKLEGQPGPGATFLYAVDSIKQADDPRFICELIRQYNIPRECVPTQWLNHRDVWSALLDSMPVQAMVRNLAKMTSVGLLQDLTIAIDYVCARLRNSDHLRRSRLHPLAILIAARQYAQGHGDKGKLVWQPVQAVQDALDDAFGLAFETIEPTGKRFYLGIDVSGSMDGGSLCGTALTCREGAMALAMQIARTEKRYVMRGFASTTPGKFGGRWDAGSTGMVDLGVTARDSLAVACQKTRELRMGGTDCALPMIDALQNKLEVDCFVIITDNETWHGRVHPMEALRDYRRQMGIPAKLCVMSLTATEFSIADPEDAGSLDVVGFDASVPAILADFVQDCKEDGHG